MNIITNTRIFYETIESLQSSYNNNNIQVKMFSLSGSLDPVHAYMMSIYGKVMNHYNQHIDNTFPIIHTFDLKGIINILMIWFIVEVLFYAVVKLTLVPRLRSTKKPLPYDSCRIELLKRMMKQLRSLSSYPKEYFITGFFLEAKLEDIYSENVRSFLAWYLFGIKEVSMNAEERNELSEAYDILCKECEVSFKPGYNPHIKHVCISWEDVVHIHRPFLVYLLSYLLDCLVILLAFRLQGYQSHELYGINYWYHPGSKDGQHLTPLVFLHGITPGWVAYIQTIRNIKHGRPVFLVELHGIKVTSFEFNMPTPDVYANTVRLMLEKHNHHKASLVGHSFGSISAAWFLKYNPDMVTHVTLIDPVSLLLFLPDVAYRFLYRPPKTLVQWVIYGYAASELTISYALRRNFWWYKNVLWLDEIPANVGVVVSLAGDDEVSNTEAIYEYVMSFKTSREKNKSVKAAPVEVLVRPGHFHGQIVVHGPEQHSLAQVINSNEKKCDSNFIPYKKDRERRKKLN